MNLYQRQIFGSKKNNFNTEIGGVSATINTASALASVLGISSIYVKDFTISGSNIKCNITISSYALPISCFQSSTAITYFYDYSGKVTNIGSNAFKATTNIYYLYFPAVITQTGTSILQDTTKATVLSMPNCVSLPIGFLGNYTGNGKVLHIPSATNLGGSQSNNAVFVTSNVSGLKIYASSVNQTSNTGGIEGDLDFAISSGATVSWVTNLTAPSAITNLSSGTVYSTAIQLNFTAPSSTNTIDYYEVYLNGVFVNTITASGSYLKGLQASTSYEIKLVAVDIYYNKSAVSNILNVSTNTTSAVPTSGLISYYKLENSNDSFGSNNLTSTNTTYSTGKVGNGGVFNATAYLTGAPLLSYGSFTICAWIKTTNTGEIFIFSNRSTSSGNPIIAMEVYSNKLFTRIRSSAGTGITSFSSLSNVNTGNWIHVAMRFDISTGLQSNFINGVLENSVSYTGGSFGGFNVGTIGVEAAASPSYGKFNGNIDEVAVYNVALTNLQLELIYNNSNGTTL